MESLGPGLFLGALSLAIAWHNVAKLRARDPIDAIGTLARLKADGVIEETDYEKKKSELLKRV